MARIKRITRKAGGIIVSEHKPLLILPTTIARPAPPPEPLPEPSLADMVSHAGGALVKWAARGFKVAPVEVRTARLAICRACPYWDESARVGFGKCKHPKCGCTKLKLAFATERCPDNRWPAI